MLPVRFALPPSPYPEPQEVRDQQLYPYVPLLAGKLRQVLIQCKRENILAIEWGPGLSDQYYNEPRNEAYLIVPTSRLADAVDIPARLAMDHLPPEHAALPHRFVLKYLVVQNQDPYLAKNKGPEGPCDVPPVVLTIGRKRSPKPLDREVWHTPVEVTIHIFDASQVGGDTTNDTLYEMSLQMIDHNRNSYRPDVILRARTYLYIICGLSKPQTPPKVGTFYRRVKLWFSQLILYDLMGHSGDVELGNDGYLYLKTSSQGRAALAKEGRARIESLNWRLGGALWVTNILLPLVADEWPYELLTRSLWLGNNRAKWGKWAW